MAFNQNVSVNNCASALVIPVRKQMIRQNTDDDIYSEDSEEDDATLVYQIKGTDSNKLNR